MQEMLQRIFGILERVRNMSVDSTWVMIAFGAVLAFGLLNIQEIWQNIMIFAVNDY